MKVKRILLTGDDGYNSIGIRLLAHFLKPKYDLTIAATKVQQSGVGGMLSIKHGGNWGKTKVDGIDTYWVSGSPCDAMELIKSLGLPPFDLALSGINLGPNLIGDLASGTMNAAVRAIKLKLCLKSIAFSWNAPATFWYHDHVGDEDIAEYYDFPGQAAFKLINEAVAHDFWGNFMLNVNFPDQPSNQVKFTRFAYYFDDFFIQLKVEKAAHKYSYPSGFKAAVSGFANTDADALRSGFISVTPCKPDLLNDVSFQALKGEVFTI